MGVTEIVSKNPLISVILPVYNSVAFLPQAIESILGQSNRDFELIIVYDESIDGSLAVVEYYQKIDSRLKLLFGQRKGIIGALNQGIDAAKGTFIARMDADDISTVDRFSKQITLLESRNADICGCHYVRVDTNNRVIRYMSVPTEVMAIDLNFCFATPFPHPGVMLRREALLRMKLRYGIGPFPAIEDFDLWAQMFSSHLVFANVDEVLLRYRIHDNKLSQQNSSRIRIQSTKLIDSIYEKNRAHLLGCFEDVIVDAVMPEANTEAAANFVFLEIFHMRFKSFFVLGRKLGISRLFQYLIPIGFRRLSAMLASSKV